MVFINNFAPWLPYKKIGLMDEKGGAKERARWRDEGAREERIMRGENEGGTVVEGWLKKGG